MAAGELHPVGPLPGSVTAVAERDGWLEDWRLAAALLALAAALAIGWTVLAVRAHRVGRRPRHPVLRRAGLGGLTAVPSSTSSTAGSAAATTGSAAAGLRKSPRSCSGRG